MKFISTVHLTNLFIRLHTTTPKPLETKGTLCSKRRPLILGFFAEITTMTVAVISKVRHATFDTKI